MDKCIYKHLRIKKLKKLRRRSIVFSYNSVNIYLLPNDVAPNPPPITGKPSKAQTPMIKQTALNLHQQVQFVS